MNKWSGLVSFRQDFLLQKKYTKTSLPTFAGKMKITKYFKKSDFLWPSIMLPGRFDIYW